MQITFLGGANEVGASSTLVEMGGKRLLIDAGIRVSLKSSRHALAADQLPDLHPISEKGGVDYILLTHAHTDHSGALPLVIEHFDVPLFATLPTIELVKVLQIDAQRIMRMRQDEEGDLPLFDEVATDRMLQAFCPVIPYQPIRLGDDLQATYYPSGHIIGACSIVLESSEGVVVMSGDLSLTPQRTVKRADLPRIKADVLVLESTYGGKLHANRAAEERRLVDMLRQMIEQEGKVLIPAFALGRAQEVLQIILAHRDQINAPVYVDGMVRAVCAAYSRFAEMLPAQTVKAAGEEHLFFRQNVNAVQNVAARQAVVRTAGPAVIVASSGMLTGGPSGFYAQELAGDPRNAILLTGYTDEESPGRFLQRMIQERAKGETVAFGIAGRQVSLRCTLDTYSLSAHADEGELVSLAANFEAEHIALVHGDAGARQSLSDRLRDRNRRILLPASGQSFEFTFASRGRPSTVLHGEAGRPVDTTVLWEQLKGQAGQTFSARKLALMWWGNIAHLNEMEAALQADALHFSLAQGDYKVRTPEQVEAAQQLAARRQFFPDMVGQLIVLRNINGETRVGILMEEIEAGFRAIVFRATGRQYKWDNLLWPVGKWEGPTEPQALGLELARTVKEAMRLRKTLVSAEQRQAWIDQAAPIDPRTLIPDTLPDGVTRLVAMLAVTLVLAEDQAAWHQNGLIPTNLRLQADAMEMNHARQMIDEIMPAAAGLRKVSVEQKSKRMILNFNFPARSTIDFAEQIAEIAEITGWEILVSPQPSPQALEDLLRQLLPEGLRLLKGPSYFLPKGEIAIEIDSVVDDVMEAVAAQFYDKTGVRLVIKSTTGYTAPIPSPVRETVVNGIRRVEINEAYRILRAALTEHGLYKAGEKEAGTIMLSFISPEVGQRHQALLDTLAAQIGYTLLINPNPNQKEILAATMRLIRNEGWSIAQGPGLHVDQAEVRVKLFAQPSPEQIAQAAAALERETGYRLNIET